MYALIATKLLIAIIGLWAMTRILGKKEISQLNAFDFVSSLMLSELVGNTIYDKEAKITYLIFALLVWTLLSFGLEKLSVRYPRLGRHASGKPELLVHQGQVDYRAMRRNNLDFDQLNMLLRENGVFALAEVAYAVFETNGSLSVLLKSDAKDENREDRTPPNRPVVLPVTLIVNGRIDREGLASIGRDGGWLVKRLLERNVDDVANVLYAEWGGDQDLHIQLKDSAEVSV